MSQKHINILGYKVLNETASTVATDLCDNLDERNCRSFAFLNPHSVVLAERDSDLKRSIMDCTDVFCDGVGLSIANLILNRQRMHRVYGYEFFMALSHELSRRRKGRVFFLGGTPESVSDLCARYAAEFPGILHIDSYAPPFKQEFSNSDISDMGKVISANHSDILWIGLGSPKQEKILHRVLQHCDVRCVAAIGAVFDFYTDRVPHSPQWVRRMGLQWAHRLVLEPKRLWKRTIISTPLFLAQVAKELILQRNR